MSFILPQVVHAEDSYPDINYVESRTLELVDKIFFLSEENFNQQDVSQSHRNRYDVVDAILQDRRDLIPLKLRKAELLNDANIEYFQAYSSLLNMPANDAITTNDYIFIKSGLQNNNWETRYLSAILLAVIHLKSSDAVEALKYAERSLSEIPENDSLLYSTERFYAHWVLYISFVIDVDLNQTLLNIEKLLAYSKLSGRKPNKFDLLNNMAVVLDKNGDLNMAIKLTEILTDEVKDVKSENSFVANLSHGRFLLKANRYSEAIIYLEKALSINEQKQYQTYIHVDLATAYAKLGQYNKAERSIRYINNEDLGYAKKYAQRHLDQPKALISASEGDYESAFNLIRQYSDQQIQFYKDGLSEDRRAANRRVILSQEIAAKNAEKAELQSKLNKEKLERQRALGQFYLALILIGAILSAVCVTFSRRLSKLNKKLIAANDEIVEKSKIKTDLLAMFSHEMLTPLNGIVPLADILQREETDLKKKKLLKMIEISGAELTRKMKDIVLVANPHDQTSRPVSVHVESFLHEILTQFHSQTQENTSLTVQMGRGMPDHLDFDVERLRAAVSALLSNAVKYTSEGQIVLSAYLNADGHLVIDVMDSGQGIEAAKLGDMTKPFGQSSLSITRENQGLGLGLTIVQLQCLIIGAAFQMESDIGVGTTARLILPLNQNRAPQDRQAQNRRAQNRRAQQAA